VLELAEREGLPVVVVNPAAPVGPRDIKPTPTGKMIRDAAAGRVPAYIDTGLNIVHVDDVAEGHVLALVMEKLAKFTGIEPMMTRDHLKMARKKMFYSSAKAMAELGYQPRPVRLAVEDAVAWFRTNGMLRG
jgi:dihydroflavonol-4-reductase